jgi:hypothetical protein
METTTNWLDFDRPPRWPWILGAVVIAVLLTATSLYLYMAVDWSAGAGNDRAARGPNAKKGAPGGGEVLEKADQMALARELMQMLPKAGEMVDEAKLQRLMDRAMQMQPPGGQPAQVAPAAGNQPQQPGAGFVPKAGNVPMPGGFGPGQPFPWRQGLGPRAGGFPGRQPLGQRGMVPVGGAGFDVGGDFTFTSDENGVVIDITGTMADGKAFVASITIQDGDRPRRFNRVDEVPVEYRPRVNRMIEEVVRRRAAARAGLP